MWITILSITVCLSAVLFLLRLLEPSVGPQEPPLVRPLIPLVGHLIGLLRHGNAYYERIMPGRRLPIYTINLFRTKVYVVTSMPVVTAIHRNSKTLSFTPFLKRMAESLSGLGPEVLHLFDRDENRDLGQEGLAVATLNYIHRALGPGAGSGDIQVSMLTNLKMSLDALESKEQTSHDLYAWVKHTVTQASTKAIYGPDSPFNDKCVENAFWEFERTAGPLLMDFAPNIVARKPVAARKIVSKAFVKYYKSEGLKMASELAKARFEPPKQYGLGMEDIARLEIPFLFAVLSTSVPATFWTLCQTYSRPELLAELRSELTSAIVVDQSMGKRTFTVEIERLKVDCPLLLSIFEETLRTHSFFSVARIVLEDTAIADGFLLKKDTLVQIPSNVVHASQSVWGATASSIDMHRFQPKAPSNKPHPLSFRSFGAPPNLCPGRHFATTEVIAILAILVMRYHITPKNGEWSIPRTGFAVFAAVSPPTEDLKVEIKPRAEWHGEWIFRLGDPTAKPVLVCG